LSSVTIWDGDEGSPKATSGELLLWRSYGEPSFPESVSIPRLVEDNAASLRRRYLGWVCEIGEAPIERKRLLDHLQIRPNFSYWWMTLFVEKCNYEKSRHIDDAIRLMALDHWAKSQHFNKLIFISANHNLATCMRLWCEQRAIAFEWQQQTKTPWVSSTSLLRSLYLRLPTWLQALVWLVYRVAYSWPLRGVGVKEWRFSTATTSFISYLFNMPSRALDSGHFESSYWAQLPDTLAENGLKTNWLHIYTKDRTIPHAKKAARLIGAFNEGGRGMQAHVTLDSFISFRVVARTLRDWLRVVRVSTRLKQTVSKADSEGLVLWPLFLSDWRESMVGPTAIGNMLMLNLFEAALKALPTEQQGVYLQENQGWEFGFLYAWRASGHGQMTGCPHSTVRYWDLRYFFDSRTYRETLKNPMPRPNVVAVNGSAARDALIQGGYPEKELVEVEALRYLYLNQPVLSHPEVDVKVDMHSVRLLVLADYSERYTRKQLKILSEAASHFPSGISMMVKPHPGRPIDHRDYPALSFFLTNAPVSELLASADIAYASSVTSAAVDAYCAGVPVIAVLDPDSLNLSPLRGYSGVLFVATPEDLVKAVSQAISRSAQKRPAVNYFNLDTALPAWKRLLGVPVAS
jgi:surface carbohydrate biosynthesis protein (TIGR04326 family)